MKNTEISFPAPLPSLKQAQSSAPTVGDCQNLVINPANGALVPFQYEPPTDAQFGTRLTTFATDDGQMSLTHNGLSIYIVNLVTGEYQSVGQLASEPTSAIPLSSTELLVFTAQGTTRLIKNDNAWTIQDEPTRSPEISLEVVDTTVYNATIRPGKLTDNYPHGTGILSKADADSLSYDLRVAYNSLYNQACADGYFIQPILARVCLYDEQFCTIYTGPTVMLGQFQLTEQLSISADTTAGTRAATAIQATAYRVAVRLPDPLPDEWKNRVYGLFIQASVPLHPLDFNASVHGNVLADTSGTSSTITCAWPGMALDRGGELQRQALVSQCLSRIDDVVANRMGFIIEPISNKRLHYYTPSSLIPDTERAQLDKILAKKVTPLTGYTTEVVRRCSRPHKFTATSVTLNGDTVLIANPKAVRYEGYPLTTMSVKRGEGSWHAYAQVTFGDGSEKVVWSGQGSDNAPLALSPIMCYPAPDAREMTIAIAYSDGTILKDTVTLTPDDSGRYSFYIHPSLQPWTPSAQASVYLIPAEQRVLACHDGIVFNTLASNPLEPLSALLAAPCAISALTPAARSTSSWDYGKSHFYAFSRFGVTAIGVGTSRTLSGANRISQLPVSTPQQVVWTDAAVYAISDTATLFSVSGNRSSPLSCVSPPWEGALPTATLTAFITPPVALSPFETPLLITTQKSVTILLAPQSLKFTRVTPDDGTDSIPILWQARIPLSTPLKRVTLDLAASDFQGSITLSLDNGQEPDGSLPLLHLDIAGEINAPLTYPLSAPLRGWATVTIDARVSPDFLFRKINLL